MPNETKQHFTDEQREALLQGINKEFSNGIDREIVTRVITRAERILADKARKREGVWVRPGDSLLSCGGVLVAARGAGRDVGFVRCSELQDAAGYDIHTHSLTTLDGRPVLGVVVPEFTEDEMRFALRDITPAAHDSSWSRLIELTIAKIRAKRKGGRRCVA